MGIHEDINTKTTPERVAIGAFGALFAVTLLSGLAMTNIKVSADESAEAETTVSITVSSACTLKSTLTTEHKAEITPGAKFTEGIGTTSMNAACNDGGGYAIYAVGYTNDTLGTTTLNGTTGTTPINTAAYTEDPTGSYWSMKLEAGTGDVATIVNDEVNYNNYVAVPSEYDKVAYRESVTTGSNLASFTTTYGAYVDELQTAGDYTGKVKYILVHPSTAEPEVEEPITGLYMQKATSEDCGETMYDIRDGEEYTTASIVGLCWMTKNLNLGSADGTMTLTKDDTNIAADTYTLPQSSTSGFSDPSAQNIYKSGSDECGDGSPCYAYYTYAAATAGTNPSEGNATSDICPKGWRLPTSDELTSLIGTYTTGEALKEAPFSAVYAGYYNYGSFHDGGAYSLYLSSTADVAGYYAYILDFEDGYAGVNSYDMYNGSSARCVAKK